MGLFDKTDMDSIAIVEKPIKRIEKKGLQDLLYEDEEKIIDYWNNLEDARELYEENDSFGADSSMHKDINSRFALARLKIATCLKDKGNYSNITKRFNDTELSLFDIIEEFRFFDDYTIEEIKDSIGRKDGKVYEVVKKYAETMDVHRDKIFENTEIKPGIAFGIKKLLKERTDKIQESVIEYIRTNPGGLTRTMNEIEKSVIDSVKESEKMRYEISADVQSKIRSLENQLEEALKTASKKDDLENRLIEMEKQLLHRDYEKSAMKNRIEGLEAEKARILDNYSSMDKVLDARIREVEEKRKLLEAKEQELLQNKANIKKELQDENRKILQDELDKIALMKGEIESQAAAIEAEKKSLEFQKEEIDEKFNLIKRAIEGGGSTNRFVSVDSAKLYEMDYIGRFDMKMHDLPMEVLNPISDKIYYVKSWNENHTKLDDKEYILKHLQGKATLNDIEAQLPLNVRSRYEVKERRFIIFGKKEPTTVIESIVFNHWKEYADNSYDTRPVNLAELNRILVNVIDNAEKGKYFHVVSIASPTGWDERIKAYIKSEDFARNYVSRFISLCLVDIETGEMIYNVADDRIKVFIHLFEPKFDKEKVQKCIESIKTKHEYDDHVVLDDIIKETGFNVNIVKKAFYDIENEGYGTVLYIDKVGLVLKFKN